MNARIRGLKPPAQMLIQAKAVDGEKTAILNLRPPTLDGMVDQGDINYISDELDYRLGYANKAVCSLIKGDLTLCWMRGRLVGSLLYILGPNPMDLVDRAHAIMTR